MKKKKIVSPPAPGTITVGKAGIYKFTPAPTPLPKKKSSIPEGIEFKIISACCEIVSGNTGFDNQINIKSHQTFWSVRVIEK